MAMLVMQWVASVVGTLCLKGPMRPSALVACNLLWACAGPISTPTLELDVAGTWSGTATFTLSGRNATYYEVPVVIAVSGKTARIGSVCPLSLRNAALRENRRRKSAAEADPLFLPFLNMAGVGAAASWSGTVACPEDELFGCNGVTVTYSNATMTLISANRLSVVVAGHAEGCNSKGPLMLTFVGAK